MWTSKQNYGLDANEFAFSPIDLSEYAMVDEWSGDKGCGVKYFSQDGVIKLRPTAGIDLKEEETPAEKLKNSSNADGGK